MKPNELLKVTYVSLSIALFISVANYWFGYDSFDLSIQLMNFAINFMFAFTITLLNSWFFTYINRFYSWADQPKQRFLLGAAGSVILTVCAIFCLQAITSLGFYGDSWEQFMARQSKELYIGSLIITMIVTVIFHAVYFYKEAQSRKMDEQRVIATSASAQFDALKNQLDPHFLFNSLNVLVALIEENPSAAVSFTTSLSKVYRYVLEQRNKPIVSLDEELDFAHSYISLLKMRFEDSMEVTIPLKAQNPDLKIVPLSLQLLIENAVKHNIVSSSKPLILKIIEQDNQLIVENNMQLKDVVKNSSGVGLQNITQRYALLGNKQMSIYKTNSHFTVNLPLLEAADLKLTFNNQTMTTTQEIKMTQAREHVADLKEFYNNVVKFALIISFLGFINLLTSDFPWVIFPLVGMSISLLFQYLRVADTKVILGKRWEQNKIEQLMNNPKF